MRLDQGASIAVMLAAMLLILYRLLPVLELIAIYRAALLLGDRLCDCGRIRQFVGAQKRDLSHAVAGGVVAWIINSRTLGYLPECG